MAAARRRGRGSPGSSAGSTARAPSGRRRSGTRSARAGRYADRCVGGARRTQRRRDGARVAGSSGRRPSGRRRRPAMATTPWARPESVQLRERRFDLAGAVRRDVEDGRARRARPTATIEPSGRNPYDDRPKTHAGSANSASMGASASSRGPSTNRYRFHQPLRSLTKCSTPSGDHSGWQIDSSVPPAPVPPRQGAILPIGATRSRVASQGMSGWSHSSHATASRQATGGARRGNPGLPRGHAASARRRAGSRRSTRPAARRRCGPRGRPGSVGGRGPAGCPRSVTALPA